MPYTDPEKKRAHDAAYYRANREKICSQAAAYYASNREAGKAARRAYRKSNLERLKAYDAQRHVENPERARAASRMRKARKKGAEGSYTAADIRRIAKAQKGKCAYCREPLAEDRHIDHIQPLSRGGSNWPRNLQLLCAPCNLAKHAADPVEFAQRTGRLL